MRAILVLSSVALCLSQSACGHHSHSVHTHPSDQTGKTVDVDVSPEVDKIVKDILSRRGAYERLVTLCDEHGHRLSGSPELEAAIAWSAEQLKSEGHDNVHLEPVEIPRWVRGQESAVIIEPRVEPMHMLGLGMSVGTPKEGITAGGGHGRQRRSSRH